MTKVHQYLFGFMLGPYAKQYKYPAGGLALIVKHTGGNGARIELSNASFSCLQIVHTAFMTYSFIFFSRFLFNAHFLVCIWIFNDINLNIIIICMSILNGLVYFTISILDSIVTIWEHFSYTCTLTHSRRHVNNLLLFLFIAMQLTKYSFVCTYPVYMNL